jgi:hypothetical protein
MEAWIEFYGPLISGIVKTEMQACKIRDSVDDGLNSRRAIRVGSPHYAGLGVQFIPSRTI